MRQLHETEGDGTMQQQKSCAFCHKIEEQSVPGKDGRQKIEVTFTPETELIVCGQCTQKLVELGYTVIPWDGELPKSKLKRRKNNA